MKILIYGDPHVNKYPQGLVEERRKSELKLFKYIYEDLVSYYNVGMCVCLGDFLHNSFLPASDVSYIMNLIDTMRGVDTVILTGNHDRSSPEDSLIKLFESMSSMIRVVDGVWFLEVDDKKLLFVSNGCIELLEKTPEYLKEADYIFTHEDYPGVVLNTNGVKSKSGYKFSEGSVKLDAILFNGHIHKESYTTLNVGDEGSIKFCNVGSVSPIAYGELELYSYPTVCILDTDTNTIQRVPVYYSVLPVTCNINDYDEKFLNAYYGDFRNLIRLRLLYTGDLPDFKDEDQYMSVEYKKLLSDDVKSEEVTTEVEDVVVNVPHYVDTFIDRSSIEESEKAPIKELCNKILLN